MNDQYYYEACIFIAYGHLQKSLVHGGDGSNHTLLPIPRWQNGLKASHLFWPPKISSFALHGIKLHKNDMFYLPYVSVGQSVNMSMYLLVHSSS